MTVIGMIGGGKHCFAAPNEMVEGELGRIQITRLKEDAFRYIHLSGVLFVSRDAYSNSILLYIAQAAQASDRNLTS